VIPLVSKNQKSHIHQFNDEKKNPDVANDVFHICVILDTLYSELHKNDKCVDVSYSYF
jgi:hypothetical protein